MDSIDNGIDNEDASNITNTEHTTHTHIMPTRWIRFIQEKENGH